MLNWLGLQTQIRAFIGLNLSRSKLAASGRLVWRLCVFMAGLDDRSGNGPAL